MSSPFHAGEQAIQEQLGVRAEMEPWARKVVRPLLPAEHSAFYSELPFLVAAARDARGRPWATLLTGAPGFAQAPTPDALHVATQPLPGDALEQAFEIGADVGFLGIELRTRRRNRVNGRITHRDGEGFVLGVEQGFGNCPQYIREREWRSVPPDRNPRRHEFDRLTPELVRRIEAADTCFLASGHRGTGEHEAFGMDASHRGGEPGFVRVAPDGRLVLPDYAGNNHFNTLGNLMLDPRLGITFVDFETGDLLQLTGRTEIDWDSPALADHAGAHRLVHFEIDGAVLLEAALPLRWAAADARQPLRVVEKIRESAEVTSFVLETPDREPAQFEPGQHLPIEVDVLGSRVQRTYSLSSAPGERHYRISVKREPGGAASNALHDGIDVGDTIGAGRPAGSFTLLPGARPVVLVSAGIGVTPMVSMLQRLAREDDPRPVWFFHGARDGRHHALATEVTEVARQHERARTHIMYSQPGAKDVLGRDYDTVGRLSGADIVAALPRLDADFYVCGPATFMAEVQAALEAGGVLADAIHTESFGPASG
ncbi:MAG: pyridoxamine 5'-phosphate oxidase family protein [Myxococcota bacterium]